MKAKDIAIQIFKAVKTHGEDVALSIDGDDILIVKCWVGCEGSGEIVDTIHTIADEDESKVHMSSYNETDNYKALSELPLAVQLRVIRRNYRSGSDEFDALDEAADVVECQQRKITELNIELCQLFVNKKGGVR